MSSNPLTGSVILLKSDENPEAFLIRRAMLYGTWRTKSEKSIGPRGLNLNAPWMSPCAKATKERVRPHPGHHKPEI